MKNHFKWVLAVWLMLFFNVGLAHDTSSQALERKIQAIAKSQNCLVGVTAIRIEDNKKISVNGERSYFMASTVKVPIAITLLRATDQHKKDLNRKVLVNQSTSVPGSGRLYDDLSQNRGGFSLSLKELLNLMMTISDNTATDLILKEIKGPKAVAKTMHQLGYHQIAIHRTILDLYLSSSGLNMNIAHQIHDKTRLLHMLEHVQPEKKVRAWRQFEQDLRDTATSDDMAKLLVHLYQGKILSPSNTKLLLSIMSHCQTGNHRIKGCLPSYVNVAHKTGTWTLFKDSFVRYKGVKNLYRFANDIGIITLPNNKGHIAIAFFVKSRGVGEHKRESVISQGSREIYNYFLELQ